MINLIALDIFFIGKKECVISMKRWGCDKRRIETTANTVYAVLRIVYLI